MAAMTEMAVRTNRIRIYPRPAQERTLIRYMGAMRYVYNWSLARWNEMHARGEKPSAYGLAKAFRQERPEWFFAMDAEIIDRATANLGRAFTNFFEKRARYPQFKRKGERDLYHVKATTAHVDGTTVHVPKVGLVEMSRPLFRVGATVGNVSIYRTANRWYACVPVECEVDHSGQANAPSVGIDLGLHSLLTLSTGEKIQNPRYLRRAQRKITLSQRRLSRARRGSKNREKAKARLARRHVSIANRRRAFIHAVTSRISKQFGAVVLEDLHVRGMLQNRKLARSLSDAAFHEIRRQLEYKMPGRVFIVDRFFPSSKTCSTCGAAKTKLPLSVRQWTCDGCGAEHDRDVNAAINLVRAIRPELTPAEIGASGPVVEAGTVQL